MSPVSPAITSTASPRRPTSRSTSSSTASGKASAVDRDPVLRPHARAARQARRVRPHRHCDGRPRGRHPPHRRGRRDRRSVPRSSRRSATRPGCAGSRPGSSRSTRRWCRSRSTSPAGRSSSTRSTRSRSGSARSIPQLAEEFWRGFAFAAGITLHLRSLSGKNGHHVIEASFKGVARCLRDAVRVEGAELPSTKGTLCRPLPVHRPARRERGAAAPRATSRPRPSTTATRSRSRASSRRTARRWIHVVDLDAARTGEAANLDDDRGDRRPRSTARCRSAGECATVDAAAALARRRRRARGRRHRRGRASGAGGRAVRAGTRTGSRSGSTPGASEVAVRGWVEGERSRPRRARPRASSSPAWPRSSSPRSVATARSKGPICGQLEDGARGPSSCRSSPVAASGRSTTCGHSTRWR